MTDISKSKNKKDIDKLVDFGKQLFSGILRSRTGSLSEMAKLLRFQPGTKGFHRMLEKLSDLSDELRQIYYETIKKFLSEKGLRIGIIDDSSIEKSGKNFPKQQKHHNHTTNSFYSGMKMLSTQVYQAGKIATISSKLVGKNDNKLDVANEDINILINDFVVDIILFDSWYCKSKVLEKIQEHNKIFISRLRANSIVKLGDDTKVSLNELIKSVHHKQYMQIKISKKSYWIFESTLDFKTYGTLRVIVSKEGQHKEPIFLITNSKNFSARFIVKLYSRRFNIEVFFKDAKQFLNLKTFQCRHELKWKLHLQLVNILHWAMQKKNSISKIVRKIRDNTQRCLLFINENKLINKIFDELKRRCQT